jgi:hypothetical protein
MAKVDEGTLPIIILPLEFERQDLAATEPIVASKASAMFHHSPLQYHCKYALVTFVILGDSEQMMHGRQAS